MMREKARVGENKRETATTRTAHPRRRDAMPPKRWTRGGGGGGGESNRLLPSHAHTAAAASATTTTSSFARAPGDGRGDRRGTLKNVSFGRNIEYEYASGAVSPKSPRTPTRRGGGGGGGGVGNFMNVLKVVLPVLCLVAAGAVLMAGFSSGVKPNPVREEGP